MHRLLALRAGLRRGAGHLRADHRGARLGQPGVLRRQDGHRADLGLRVLRRLRAGLPDGDACRKSRSSRSARPNVRSSPPAPIAAWAVPSRPRCAATNWCGWTPYKHGKANRGHSCVKGRFAYGYASHTDRILNPMIRESINEPWREVSWDEALGFAAARMKGDPGEARASVGRGHHLHPLHE